MYRPKHRLALPYNKLLTAINTNSYVARINGDAGLEHLSCQIWLTCSGSIHDRHQQMEWKYPFDLHHSYTL
ncbi:hypothetical protein AB6F55_16310 [Providencia hangzhouensis]